MTWNVSLVSFEIGEISPRSILIMNSFSRERPPGPKAFLTVSECERSSFVANTQVMVGSKLSSLVHEAMTAAASRTSIYRGMLTLMIAPGMTLFASLFWMKKTVSSNVSSSCTVTDEVRKSCWSGAKNSKSALSNSSTR